MFGESESELVVGALLWEISDSEEEDELVMGKAAVGLADFVYAGAITLLFHQRQR